MVPDFSHIFSSFAILLGAFGGIVLAIVLAMLGHGWWSLLAIPATPFALWCPAALMERLL
jgi:hypothetical protein